MAEQLPDMTPEHPEPIIPPQYLLILAGVAFLVALVVALTQAEFSVVGYGALAFGVLALIAWALMAPDQARAALSGRTARFGGLSFLVTIILISALIVVYIFVRNQNLRVDLTQRDEFSLNEASEEAISTYGADPTVPPVKIVAFYSSLQAGRRDQDSVLFEDYVRSSGGKISYEFIDLNRNPAAAQQYGITQDGQIAVVAAADDGTPDIENAELVSFFSQDDLTNAILKVSAGGDFRVYVMRVEGGISALPNELGSMSELVTGLSEQLDWNVQDVSILDLARPESEITLNDPNADGEVMLIVGGTEPLAEQELEIVTNYLDTGGQVVIFAGDSLNTEEQSLATDEALSQYLFDNFGLRFRNDVVLDNVQAFQTPLNPVATDLDPTHFITTAAVEPGQTGVIFSLARSIEVADAAPENVTVSPIIRSSESAYGETDFQSVIEGTPAQSDEELAGPVVLGAVAENAQTGAKVILFGSTSLVLDQLTQLQSLGVGNLQIAFNALIDATDYNDFFQRTTVVSQQRPQDTPIFADAQTLRTINFITLILLPFGVLAIGILVWWNNRERERAS